MPPVAARDVARLPNVRRRRPVRSKPRTEHLPVVRRAPVERAPRTEHLPVVRRAPVARPTAVAPAGDVKSEADLNRAKRYVRKRPFRGAVVAAYTTRPVKERKAIARRATRAVEAGTATEAEKAIEHAHRTRVEGSRRVGRAGRAFEALDPESTALRHALAEIEEPEPRRAGAQGGAPAAARAPPPSRVVTRGPYRPSVDEETGVEAAAEDIGKAITAIGGASAKGYASVNAPKILVNAPKDVAEIAVTTPSSIAKLASDIVHRPSKVPGELIAPYRELIKDPKAFIEERPVSAALMVAPVARVPGRAAGKVARVAGKQTLARPAAVYPGTNLRQARTGSRDIVVRAVQSARDKRRPAPTMTEGQVVKRVDSFFDAARRERDRQAAAIVRDKGVDTAAAYKVARKTTRRRFAEEFGGAVHPSKEAAAVAAETLPFEGRVMKVGKGRHTVVPKAA
jgi:hypothetical protein